MLFLTRTKRAAEGGNGNRSVKLGRKTPKVQIDSSTYSVNGNTVSIILDRAPELSRVWWLRRHRRRCRRCLCDRRQNGRQ